MRPIYGCEDLMTNSNTNKRLRMIDNKIWRTVIDPIYDVRIPVKEEVLKL